MASFRGVPARQQLPAGRAADESRFAARLAGGRQGYRRWIALVVAPSRSSISHLLKRKREIKMPHAPVQSVHLSPLSSSCRLIKVEIKILKKKKGNRIVLYINAT